MSALRNNMPMIVSGCQHFNEQHFQTLPCLYYAIFSVVKLDLCIRALSLDHTLAQKKNTHTPSVLLDIHVISL